MAASHSLRGLCGLKFSLGTSRKSAIASQPARAVWIEIGKDEPKEKSPERHSLRGLCGLKSSEPPAYPSPDECHSLRGLCGLKCIGICKAHGFLGHSLRGLCGLKFFQLLNPVIGQRHSLRGLCGLKSMHILENQLQNPVTACEGCVD